MSSRRRRRSRLNKFSQARIAAERGRGKGEGSWPEQSSESEAEVRVGLIWKKIRNPQQAKTCKLNWPSWKLKLELKYVEGRQWRGEGRGGAGRSVAGGHHVIPVAPSVLFDQLHMRTGSWRVSTGFAASQPLSLCSSPCLSLSHSSALLAVDGFFLQLLARSARHCCKRIMFYLCAAPRT